MAKNIKATELQYDIHKHCVAKVRNMVGISRLERRRLNSFLSPTHILRRIGFPTTESVWVILTDHMPHEMLHEWNNLGVTWGSLDYATGQDEKFLGMAQKSLETQIKEQEARNCESITNAAKTRETALAAATCQRETEAAERTYETAVRNAERRIEKLTRDLRVLATNFGLDAGPIATARQSMRAIFTIARNRSDVAVQLAAQTGLIPETPVGILLDKAEEDGVEGVEETRAMFSTETATATLTMHTANGTHVDSSALRDVTAQRSEATETVVFTVHTRNGIRRCNSPYSDREAKVLCSQHNWDFARDLATRSRLSPTQRAWLHILACEEAERITPAPVAAPAAAQITTPAPITAPPAPVVTPALVAAPKAADDSCPAEKVATNGAAVEISTEKMVYKPSTKTLTVEMSDLGLSGFFRTLVVRSHRTGSKQTFSFAEEEYQADEMVSVLYRCGETHLRIIND